MQKYLISACLALVFIQQFAAAQTQPVCISSSTPSVDFCQDACVYCNLSGFSGTTSGFSNQYPPGGFCGTIENEQWVAFIAVATSAEITATPFNCQFGNGVQIALYPDCFSVPVNCNGGGQFMGDTPVSISVDLVPGQTYFLMIDGYQGDVCDFTLNMTPPSAGSANVTAHEIRLCPGKTYTIDGVAYAAPSYIPVTLAENGDCDSILVYNILPVQTAFIEQTLTLCQDESATLGGQTYTAPDTVVLDISGNSGCDSVLTYYLLLKEYNHLAEDVFFCPGESVVVAGASYSVAGVVRDTFPGTTSCDTIKTYTLQYFLDPGECPSCSPTFVQTLGFEGQNVRGHGIYPSPDGYLYVTGSKQDSSLLLKITPAGTVVWMRTFDFLPGREEHIAEIITDADNMIAGCGRSDTAQADYTGFVFRYDPAADTLLWNRSFSDELPDVNGILQAFPSGSYVVYYRQNVPEVNAGMIEVGPPDGNFLDISFGKKFDNGGVDNFASMVWTDLQLYAIGTYTGFGAAIHSGLTRMTSGGSVNYALEYHVHDDSMALLSGRDLVVEGNFIFSVISGNETGYDLNNSRIFLQRNSRGNGGVSWIKRIDLEGTGSEIADEIVSVPDGFVLYCRSLYQDNNLFYLVKTDKSGNLLWSKKVNHGTYSSFLGTTSIQSQILTKGNYLYAVATMTDNTGHDRLLLLKTRGDATLDGDCNFISETPVTVTDVTAPKQYAVFAAEIPPALDNVTEQAASAATALTLKKECRVLLQTQTDIAFCSGQSVMIDGVVYTASGIVKDTLPGAGCDTVITYNLTELTQFTQSDTLRFCPGETVTIDGIPYTQSGTVTDTIPGAGGCDTIITYTLILQAQPVLTQTISFCPGETITVGGIAYDQPGTVVDTIPAGAGCDTVVTYTLQYQTTPNSTLSINCPDDISVAAAPGAGSVNVDYDLPALSTDCECPGIALTLTSGFDPGSAFPVGTTPVCYAARDSCGNTAACCFDVLVSEDQADEPCDVKVIGCMTYELLTITKDATESEYTYRIRVTNSCTNKMIYTAIQVPDGITALEPPENSVYTAPGGRPYDVRNPNFSPFYSIRFKSKTDSIAGGESDIFEYVLPGQTSPTYIHVGSRLYPQVFYEAHLNTFYCPIGVTPADRSDRSGGFRQEEKLRLYPNPTTGVLYADLSAWRDEPLQMQIFDSRGLQIQALRIQAGEALQPLQLSEGLANGMYFLKVSTERGERYAGRFVLQR